MPHHTAMHRAQTAAMAPPPPPTATESAADRRDELYEVHRKLQSQQSEIDALDSEYDSLHAEIDAQAGNSHEKNVDFKKLLLGGSKVSRPSRPGRFSLGVPDISNYDIRDNVGVAPTKPQKADFDTGTESGRQMYHVATMKYVARKEQFGKQQREGTGTENYILDVQSHNAGVAGKNQQLSEHRARRDKGLRDHINFVNTYGIGYGSARSAFSGYDTYNTKIAGLDENKDNRRITSEKAKFVYPGSRLSRSQIKRGAWHSISAVEWEQRRQKSQRERASRTSIQNARANRREASSAYARNPITFGNVISNWKHTPNPGSPRSGASGFAPRFFTRREKIKPTALSPEALKYAADLTPSEKGHAQTVNVKTGGLGPRTTDVDVVNTFLNQYKSTEPIKKSTLEGLITESGAERTPAGAAYVERVTRGPEKQQRFNSYYRTSENVVNPDRPLIHTNIGKITNKRTGEFYNFKTTEGNAAFGQQLLHAKSYQHHPENITFEQYLSTQGLDSGPGQSSSVSAGRASAIGVSRIGALSISNYASRAQQSQVYGPPDNRPILLHPITSKPESIVDSFGKRGVSNLGYSIASIPTIASNFVKGENKPTPWEHAYRRGEVAPNLLDAGIESAFSMSWEPWDEYKRENRDDLYGAVQGDVLFEGAFAVATGGGGRGIKIGAKSLQAAGENKFALQLAEMFAADSGVHVAVSRPKRTWDLTRFFEFTKPAGSAGGADELVGFMTKKSFFGSRTIHPIMDAGRGRKAHGYVDNIKVLAGEKQPYALKSARAADDAVEIYPKRNVGSSLSVFEKIKSSLAPVGRVIQEPRKTVTLAGGHVVDKLFAGYRVPAKKHGSKYEQIVSSAKVDPFQYSKKSKAALDITSFASPAPRNAPKKVQTFRYQEYQSKAPVNPYGYVAHTQDLSKLPKYTTPPPKDASKAFSRQLDSGDLETHAIVGKGMPLADFLPRVSKDPASYKSIPPSPYDFAVQSLKIQKKGSTTRLDPAFYSGGDNTLLAVKKSYFGADSTKPVVSAKGGFVGSRKILTPWKKTFPETGSKLQSDKSVPLYGAGGFGSDSKTVKSIFAQLAESSARTRLHSAGKGSTGYNPFKGGSFNVGDTTMSGILVSGGKKNNLFQFLQSKSTPVGKPKGKLPGDKIGIPSGSLPSGGASSIVNNVARAFGEGAKTKPVIPIPQITIPQSRSNDTPLFKLPSLTPTQNDQQDTLSLSAMLSGTKQKNIPRTGVGLLGAILPKSAQQPKIKQNVIPRQSTRQQPSLIPRLALPPVLRTRAPVTPRFFPISISGFRSGEDHVQVPRTIERPVVPTVPFVPPPPDGPRLRRILFPFGDDEDDIRRGKKKKGLPNLFFGSNLPKHSFIGERWDRPDIFHHKDESVIDVFLGDRPKRKKGLSRKSKALREYRLF